MAVSGAMGWLSIRSAPTVACLLACGAGVGDNTNSNSKVTRNSATDEGDTSVSQEDRVTGSYKPRGDHVSVACPDVGPPCGLTVRFEPTAGLALGRYSIE